MTAQRMDFGIFMAPFHTTGQNPTLALQRDLELIQWLDQLGYDEAWIGEHHSAGWETIASPEVFIAAAGERTQLHFSTPGGTRIIWTLDPAFQLKENR